MNIAIIPARGGSKRIPYKNIRKFCGKPMLVWSIETAMTSGLFEHIYVSTDDKTIAQVAGAAGAQIIERPANLADNHTATQPVIAHAIGTLSERGLHPSAVCCIYATAPFITAKDLRAGLQPLDDPSVSYSFAATRFNSPIQRAFFLDGSGRPQMFQPEHALTRSQDLVEAFHDAGQFYWAKPTTWASGMKIMGSDSRPVFLPPSRVQDIDDEEDWSRAEILFQTQIEKLIDDV